MAESMGLPRTAVVPPEMRMRGYVTLIGAIGTCCYEQVMELLEMTPERLPFALRGVDMLWVELGRLKPKSEPLRYRPPDQAARRRAAEIRRVVERRGNSPPGRTAFQIHSATQHPTSRPLAVKA